MKTVILTCNTGQGHNSAGLAIAEEFRRRGDECEFKDALSFLGEKASELIAGSFVNIAVKTPRAFGFMYQAGEQISSDKLKSPVYFANALYAENLLRYLDEQHIDAAICPHLFPMEALTFLKRRHKLQKRAYFVSTDYTCIPFLEETDADAVFLPSPDLKEQFEARGIPAQKLVDAGIPVREAFREATGKSAARAELQLPENADVFLVMTGGEGCGNAGELSEKLLSRVGADARVVVLAGRNDELRSELIYKFGTDERLMALGFTERAALYLRACDVLLTKPGGISSTEAAVCGVPMVHTAPIPGCETLNARFFSQRGMSLLADDSEQAAFHAVRLCRDTAAKQRMLEAQKQYIDPFAAEKICDYIRSR